MARKLGANKVKVLRALKRGSLPVIELSHATGLSLTVTSLTLASLVADGLVERSGVVYFITMNGRAALDQAQGT